MYGRTFTSIPIYTYVVRVYSKSNSRVRRCTRRTLENVSIKLKENLLQAVKHNMYTTVHGYIMFMRAVLCFTHSFYRYLPRFVYIIIKCVQCKFASTTFLLSVPVWGRRSWQRNTCRTKITILSSKKKKKNLVTLQDVHIVAENG